MAAWPRLGVTIFPAAVQVPLPGSYSWDEVPPLSSDEHPAIAQQRGRARIGFDHPPGGGPRPTVRVVHLRTEGRVERARVVGIPDEHPAIAQQCGREATRCGLSMFPVADQVPVSGS